MAQGNQLFITGHISAPQGNSYPYLKIELRDSAGLYGLIETTYTDNSGNFSFLPSPPASSLIISNSITPQYFWYLSHQLLSQQKI